MTRSFIRFDRLFTGATAIVAPLASVVAGVAAYVDRSTLEYAAIGVAAAAGAFSLVFRARADKAQARMIDRITDVCQEITNGNFEARIAGIDDSGHIAEAENAVNDMIDRCDAFVREATASLESVCRGVYYRRILEGGLKGSFRVAAQIINQSVAQQGKAIEQAEQERRAVAAEQTRVIDGLGQGLENLARGNLDFRLGDFPKTYERLKDDFNSAADRLERTLANIASGASVIGASTRDVAAATEDLSRRTEMQAAHLGETAAAINEVATMVAKTADGAHRANEAVSMAKSEAEGSGEIVRCAIDAISRIEKSSQDIAHIIGVIDEIAFQTNLLALNAGVEAARAGEAGKGFAVVAAEVRALAQRSAEAAKEIKKLISVSSTEVQAGVSQVTETGKALERIVAQVAEITQVVEETATDVMKQSAILQQINSAIEQMDEDTQKNAAMVEQTTAATQSLRKEAGELESNVREFTMSASALKGSTHAANETAPVAWRKKPAMMSRGGRVQQSRARAEEDWAEF